MKNPDRSAFMYTMIELLFLIDIKLWGAIGKAWNTQYTCLGQHATLVGKDLGSSALLKGATGVWLNYMAVGYLPVVTVLTWPTSLNGSVMATG